jgi:alpha-ketoglutarate-dependent taurine dioxygenase
MSNPAREPLPGEQPGLTTNVHPVYRTYPVTGRKAFYINESVTNIVEAEATASRSLVQHLMAHGTQDRFVYRWTVGNLVIGDNRSTMHRTAPYDQKCQRRMQAPKFAWPTLAPFIRRELSA